MRNDDLRDLREQRKRVHTQMVQLNEKAAKEGRDLTAEEDENYGKMVTEFEELERRVRREAQLGAMQKELEEEKRTFFLPNDQPAPQNLAEYRAQAGHVKVQDEPEYRQAFYHYMTARDPRNELEVEEHRVLSRATAGAGGNLVPTDMYDQIIRSLRFQGSIASLATVITTTARVRVVDVFAIDFRDMLEGQAAPMHGDEVDTSLLLFLAPHLVQMDLAEDYMMSREELRRYRRGWLKVPKGSSGSIGRPSLASAAKGAAIYAHIRSKVRARVFLTPEPDPD